MFTSTAPIHLRQIRSFFVGGKTRLVEGLPVTYKSMVLNGTAREVNPNGSHTFGQMYVQEFRLANPAHPHPILLWYGGGMTGCTWETTPDGRPGWLWRFLEAGYNVFVSDAVERGRSSWAMYPQVYESEPVFRTKQEGWTTFRLGLSFSDSPQERHAFEGQKFPIIAGDDDPLVPSINARLMARLIPRSELKILEDGHLFLMSQPDTCATAVNAFLSGG